MYYRDPRKLFCLAAGILGIVLIGLGVFLLATGFSINAITIGTIVSGIVLLVVCGLSKCMRLHCLTCLLFLLITLFLIIAGILTILFTGSLIVALILIGLGIIALILDVVCLILKLCRITVDKGEPPFC